MSTRDAELMERWVGRRDAAAFDELVTQYASMVYGTCQRILRNPSDAEDLTQECFLTLSRAETKVSESLGGWLHRVATNRALSLLRKRSRRGKLDTQHTGQGLAEAGQTWDDVQEYVDEAIESLPEDLRAVVVASFLERQTHQVLAKQLGVSRQAVSHRVSRGVEEIRRSLKKKGVTITSATLATLLGVELIEAAPPMLMATLGRLAISGATTLAVGGTSKAFVLGGMGKFLGGLFAMKKALALASVLGLAGAALVVSSLPDAPGDALAGTETSPVGQVLVALVADDPELNPPVDSPVGLGVQVAQAKAVEPALETNDKAVPPVDDEQADAQLLPFSTLTDFERADYPGFIENPAERISLSGWVFGKDGEPIPNAQVTAVAEGPFYSGYAVWRAFRDTGRHYRTTTDINGRYEIRGVQYYGKGHISASADGYVSDAAHPQFRLENTQLEQNVVLSHEGLPLVGRLLSPGGNPVTDAFVFAPTFVSDSGANSSWNEAFGYTDAAGVFRLGLKHEFAGRNGKYFGTRGWAVVMVESPEYGPAVFYDVAAGADEFTDLRMKEPAQLTGTVQLSSAEVPHCVSLTAILDQSYYDLEGNPTRRNARDRGMVATYSVSVNPDGTYTLSGVPAGVDFELVVNRYMDTEIRHRELIPPFDSGERRVWNKTIGGDLVISGRVTGTPSGDPLPDVLVTYGEIPRESRGHAKAITGPDGEYRLVFGREPYRYQFFPSYRTISSWYDLRWMMEKSGETVELTKGTTVNLDLVLADPLAVTIKAVDEQGNPVSGVAVWVGFAQSLFTNKEGVWQRRLNPGSSHSITLKKEGYVASQARLLYWGEPGDVIDGAPTIMYRAAGGLEGTFVDTAGNVRPDTLLWGVAVTKDGREFFRETTTDGEGKFTFLNWPPVGQYPQLFIARRTEPGGANHVAVLSDLEFSENNVVMVGEVNAGDFREPGGAAINVTLSNIPKTSDWISVLVLPGDIKALRQVTDEAVSVRRSIRAAYAPLFDRDACRLSNLAPGKYTVYAFSWPTGRSRTVEQYGGFPKQLADIRDVAQVVQIDHPGEELFVDLAFPD